MEENEYSKGDEYLDLSKIKEPVVLQMEPTEKSLRVLSPTKLSEGELHDIAKKAGILESGGRGLIVMEAAAPIPPSLPSIAVEYTYVGHIFFPPSLACFHVFACRIIIGVQQTLFASSE